MQMMKMGTRRSTLEEVGEGHSFCDLFMMFAIQFLGYKLNLRLNAQSFFTLTVTYMNAICDMERNSLVLMAHCVLGIIASDIKCCMPQA